MVAVGAVWALIFAQTPPSVEAPVVGVLRVARGEVSACEGPARSGPLLRSEDCLQVRDGWAEIMIGAHLRVRLSAETRVRVGAERLSVLKGRAWFELGGREAFEVRLQEKTVRLEPKSSIVVDAPGAAVAVLAGHLGVAGLRASAGQLVDCRHEEMVIRTGGSETASLVRKEARSGLGDLAGWRAFLLTSVREAAPGRRPPRFLGDLGPLRPLMGRAGASALHEEALRPPPFFPEEIPPPGPNVRVEVEFDDVPED